MNQIMIGKFIAKRRKEKNITQAQLAEIVGVTNKSISKWECGKCMPDYSIVESLCHALDITVAELMDGEATEIDSLRIYDDKQILEMLSRLQNLEKQKNSLIGFVILTMGVALLAFSQVIGGTNIRDFIAGLMLGLSIGEMLVGLYVVARSFSK